MSIAFVDCPHAALIREPVRMLLEGLQDSVHELPDTAWCELGSGPDYRHGALLQSTSVDYWLYWDDRNHQWLQWTDDHGREFVLDLGTAITTRDNTGFEPADLN